MRRIGMATGMALTVLSGPALAQEQPRQRVEAVVECLDVADGPQRLACFDRTAAILRDAMRAGTVAIERPERVQPTYPIATTIVSASTNGMGRWQLSFENGHVYVTDADMRMEPPPRLGTAVQIERGPVSGFMMRITANNRRVRVIRQYR